MKLKTKRSIYESASYILFGVSVQMWPDMINSTSKIEFAIRSCAYLLCILGCIITSIERDELLLRENYCFRYKKP